MLKLTFYLKQISEEILELRLFWGFRAVFLVLFGLILGSILVPRNAGSEGASILAVILLVLFAFIMVYDEKWIFDTDKGQVVHAHGILFVHRKTVYGKDEISQLSVTEFRKGSIVKEEKRRYFQRDLLRLSMELKETQPKDIEISEKKNITDLQGKAAAIAQFMNLPYHSDL